MHTVSIGTMQIHEKQLLDIIARNIRKRRSSLGLSQEELADIAGVHRTYIGMIERSEKNVTVLTLEKIANALHTPVDTLLRKENTL